MSEIPDDVANFFNNGSARRSGDRDGCADDDDDDDDVGILQIDFETTADGCTTTGNHVDSISKLNILLFKILFITVNVSW